MPIYEYRCPKCDYTFEKYTGGAEEAGSKGPSCPRCGRKGSEKVFSLFSSQCSSAPGAASKCGSGGFS